MAVVFKAVVSERAKRDLRKHPLYIADKLEGWVQSVEKKGLEEVRKVPGYHDEPLHGGRKGQRSIRLSLHYRAIYVIKRGTIEVAEVQEVTKHEY